jgi:hypothetical protein
MGNREAMLELIGRAYAARGRGDLDELMNAFHPEAAWLHMARRNGVETIKVEADRHAANVLPIIREAERASARTLREIAETLNARGIPTARGASGTRNRWRTCWRGATLAFPQPSGVRGSRLASRERRGSGVR